MSYAPGDNKKVDSEYVRNGICSIFAFVESLGRCYRENVRRQRTTTDCAEGIQYLVDEMNPGVEEIILVMDNLNTNKPTFFYWSDWGIYFEY